MLNATRHSPSVRADMRQDGVCNAARCLQCCTVCVNSWQLETMLTLQLREVVQHYFQSVIELRLPAVTNRLAHTFA
jgi:hypothetical protein